ncbi:mannonate dehydratase [Leifsonia sp. NPDC056824]|uniref:mannonate dehydratase n=1 Tax=Leifsonia sp. NPDC056824 TaxID=3345953 RepID=UPI0036A7DF7C
MIQLTELLSPRPEPEWRLIKQCGVNEVVGLLNGAEQDQRMFASVGAAGFGASRGGDSPWSEAAIRHDMGVFEDYGFTLVALEDTAPIDKVRLGLPGRDEQIDNVLTQVRAMGRLGIPTLCYNWMAISSWARTAIDLPGRGGALVTGFRAADLDGLEPLAQPGEITAEQLWGGLQYFLDAVVPVAEEAGVRLGMHPDDPPRPEVRNVPRIMSSPEAYRRMLSLRPSASNAITFCQGNFALMADDLPALIREFGRGDHIAFVHFRDVQGTVEDFRECFHDEGQNDMPECMRAYAEIGFSGPMRPDHVPTMFGETNDRPAYGTLGRIFALGYIRGLEQSAYGTRTRELG